MNTPGDTLIHLGWREWLSIPALGIRRIKAKIDTGARTSALHTGGLEIYEAEDGTERVRFTVHPLQRRPDYEVFCDCPVLTNRTVKDSGGHIELRPFIRVPVQLGEHVWPIDFSLTNRDNMKFRMLLGRTAMVGRFAVNPASSYLVGKPRPKLR